MRRARAGFVLLLLILLSSAGCTTKIAYNYAHWWANWTVDDYIDLNREQKAFFKSEFRQLHQWHRQTQLPLYVSFLKQTQAQLSAPSVSAETLHQQILATQSLLENSKQQATAPLAELLESLSAKQRDKLLATLQKETAKYRKKNTYKNDDKRHKVQQKSMGRFVKKWLGPLSKQQKQRIQEWSVQTRPMAELDAGQQQLWQEKFSSAIASEQADAIKLFLDDYLLDDESLWTAEYRQNVEYNRSLIRELLIDLLNNRSDKQRRHLDKKLQRLIEDFQQLGNKVSMRQPTPNGRQALG
ncbi:DUF6279 family lipoprotein [Porticoccus sp. GXU_MW_L64]